ncbi:MAG: LCP family protein [Ilumatobacter sp.]
MEEDGEQRETPTRTWGQRLLIALAAVVALGSFATAAAVWVVQQQLEARQLITIAPDSASAEASALDAEPGTATTVQSGDDQSNGGDLFTEPGEAPPTAPDDTVAPVETFPLAEPAARNILITGADNNACIDPDSPFAGSFGDRTDAGERSDTIMMWRVTPATNQVAVLSFPRDLWVPIAGRSGKSRINAAYERDNPQRLIDTIRQYFDIDTDHFVQVDFCAFKELVDSVGGVAVPFDTPVRDPNTGLNVPEPGCFTFSGEHALAYVRSRKIQFLDEDGEWSTDGTSDLGRISRQQDFIRRVADELLANAFSPSVVSALLDVSREYIVTDDGLTPDKILELAGVLQNTNPATITTYQIQARNTVIQGNAVLEPLLGGNNMQAVLALFRGEVTLAQAPEQDLDDTSGTATTAPPTTVPVIDPDIGTTTTTTVVEEAAPSTEAVPFDTIPEVEAEDIVFGVRPDTEISCTG